MAFTGTMGVKDLDKMRYGSNDPHHEDERTFPAYTPLQRGSTAQSSVNSGPPDTRATLHRRFTTDSMNPPQLPFAWDPSGYQRIPVADSLDLAPGVPHSTSNKVQELQQKQYEYQMRIRKRESYQNQLALLDMQNKRDRQEMIRMAQDIDRMSFSGRPAGHSEPTTPPDLRDSAFSRSRAAMQNVSALATPPAFGARHEARQLMTPPAEDSLPGSKSMPGSRRNSDENENNLTPTQAPVGQHRNGIKKSLPNGSIARPGVQKSDSGSSVLGLGQINTTNFLFDDEADRSTPVKNVADPTSPQAKSYFQMTDTDDKFPILVRRDDFPGMLSASSRALDLALTQKTNDQESPRAYNQFARHRPSQHSLPMNNYPFTPTSNASPKITVPQTDSPTALRRHERISSDFPFGPFSENLNAKLSQNDAPSPVSMPKLQSSYSTSDLPTVRNSNNNVNNHPNLSRVAVDRHMHSREPSTNGEFSGNGIHSFGPPLPANIGQMSNITPGIVPSSASPSTNAFQSTNGFYPAGYPSYNIPNPPVFHAAPFGAYPIYGHGNKVGDGLHRGNHTMQPRNPQKRHNDGEANRFANVNLENLVGEIFSLCKDQHGCRYLQKKLEERNPQYVQMIFLETHAHVVELMTDPFGNYLCQKLLEYANDEQRTVLVNTAAPQLVDIALNQHGTRALQKMIEYISTPEQIETIVRALESKVVELIQDLNGNHVIQKCLNRLKAEDAQFIFDAVGKHCVTVGTHRHGCCVLQRCIDHASGHQKVQLIQQITDNWVRLVGDPFGNYVIQYILDLADSMLSEPLIAKFRGRVCELSKQKFSSNVIEKCIRVAEPSTKKALIEEMLNPADLEMLLRDNFANYVIQTSIDYADPTTKQQLVDNIRPFLPVIRMTSYGRRIQTKLGNQNHMPYHTGNAPSGPPPPTARTNFYNQPQGRPNPVQQPYTSAYRPEMGNPSFI